MDATILKRLRDDLDIVEVVSEYVPLSKKGRSFVGLCPFHDDKNPSMSVSPAKQFFNCFSCGAKGDVITFVARIEKIPYAAAVSKLAARLGITYDAQAAAPRYPEGAPPLLAALRDAADYYEYARELAPAAVQAYLATRHLSPALTARFRIGYAAPQDNVKQFLMSKGHDEATLINASLVSERGPAFFQNRLMFPLINEHNDVVGFSGRTLDNNAAKYINSGESLVFRKSHLLYNLAAAHQAITQTQRVIVCEGQMDVIALVASGIENVVAVMGTALTPEHLQLLPGTPQVILNFDGDAAGRAATEKSLNLLYQHNFRATVVVTESAKDVDELWRSAGPAAVQAALTRQVDALIWSYETARASLGVTPAPGAVDALITKLAPLWQVSSPLTQSVLIEQMHQAWNVPVAGLTAAFATATSQLAPPRALAPPAAPMDEALVLEPPLDPRPAVTRPLRYTHLMLKSMLHSPALVTFYAHQAAHVHIAEAQLEALAQYLVAHQQNPTPPDANTKKVIADVEATATDEIVTTAEQFTELIGRVNVEFYNYYIKTYRDRIKPTSSAEEISEIYRAVKEFKAKKEKIHNEE